MDALPPNTKTKLTDNFKSVGRSPAGRDGQPSLRDLLDASYLVDLSTIISVSHNWPSFQPRFGSKKAFERAVNHLNRVRSPLAHNRSMPEETRRAVEEAARWLKQALDLSGSVGVRSGTSGTGGSEE